MKKFLACSILSLALASHAADAINLFDGKDLSNWREPRGKWEVAKSVSLDPKDPHLFVIEPGTGIFVNGPTGKERNLKTKGEYGDAEIHVEFNVSSNSNSGVYVQGRYEVQIFDSWGVPNDKLTCHQCGGIYERWINGKGVGGQPARVNASKRPGEWQTFDITYRAPRFDAAGKKTENGRFIKVVQNGTVIHENVEVIGPTRSAAYNNEAALGPIMLQGDHGPVAFRKMRITPLHLP
jgi:hypothetical protein